jgi:hypothetical protein
MDYDALSYCNGDCDDNNPNAWNTCATCIDNDGDGWYGLCNQYYGINGSDCDDLESTAFPYCRQFIR